MIEKLKRGPADTVIGVEMQEKINELIEASNRQDRVIAFLLGDRRYRAEIAAAIGDKDEFYYREIKSHG